jgi:hypothetical protein
MLLYGQLRLIMVIMCGHGPGKGGRLSVILSYQKVSSIPVLVPRPSRYLRPETRTTLMMNRPTRFNAKARRNGAGSSHKRGKSRGKQLAVDTNADIVQHKSTEEKELSRREQLKQEVSVYRR